MLPHADFGMRLDHGMYTWASTQLGESMIGERRGIDLLIGRATIR